MAESVKRICDEVGVCIEEALFYLDGFRWDLDAAMEACRNKTLPLPSLAFKSSPVNEKFTLVAPSKTPLVIDSCRISNQVPNPPEELSSLSRNKLIELFYETAVGTTVQEAEYYLNRCNWNADLAVGLFIDERRATPSQRKLNPQGFSEVYRPMIGQSNSQRYSKDDYSTYGRWNSQPFSKDDHMTTAQSYMQGFSGNGTSELMQDYPKKVKIRSSCSNNFMEVYPRESIKEGSEEHIPLMASSQVKIQSIQESTTPPQSSKENGVLVDGVCDETKVSREEAFFYLEGFKWKFDAATEACRIKTLPSVKEVSSPGVSLSEESTAEATLMEMNSLNSPEQLSELDNKRIESFLEAAGEATREEAISYLSLYDWDVNQAVGCFIDLETMQFQGLSGYRNLGYLKEGETGNSSRSTKDYSTKTGNVTLAINENSDGCLDASDWKSVHGFQFKRARHYF